MLSSLPSCRSSMHLQAYVPVTHRQRHEGGEITGRALWANAGGPQSASLPRRALNASTSHIQRLSKAEVGRIEFGTQLACACHRSLERAMPCSMAPWCADRGLAWLPPRCDTRMLAGRPSVHPYHQAQQGPSMQACLQAGGQSGEACCDGACSSPMCTPVRASAAVGQARRGGRARRSRHTDGHRPGAAAAAAAVVIYGQDGIDALLAALAPGAAPAAAPAVK